MLVNITRSFAFGGREYVAGQNPDVDPQIARQWIADGRATADADNSMDWPSPALQALVSGAGNLTATYDGSGRMASLTRAGGRRVAFAYPSNTQMVVTEQGVPNPAILTCTTDTFGRVMSVTPNW